ncbi:olfactory receptor-like protein OLF3 [Protopterus annectens]|uniref:olfactory receptor-like protein OLF3 n=1 Tax=Protopterus annectens TaxID=7888 RepID=UPI001CFB2377|nr:olfactory receptor-like protein OLF3 [Protopterus annectens]
MANLNTTEVHFQELIITGFQDIWDRESKLSLCSLFLLTYIITILGNLVFVILVKLNRRLHAPMYYFICNLALLDICIPSVTVPKIASYLLFENRSIKLEMCLTQMLFYIGLWIAESFSLTVMSYDRYQAICNPLMYPSVMSNNKSIKLSIICWIGGMTIALFPCYLFLRAPICGSNKVNHSFCDYFVLIQLACTNIASYSAAGFTASSFLVLPLVVILFSYSRIMLTLQKITSLEGRKKAFSTSASHLLVIAMFYLLPVFAFICNKTPGCSANTWLMAATMQNILPPMINPFIYSFRTKEIRECFIQLLRSLFGSKLPLA